MREQERAGRGHQGNSRGGTAQRRLPRNHPYVAAHAVHKINQKYFLTQPATNLPRLCTFLDWFFFFLNGVKNAFLQ